MSAIDLSTSRITSASPVRTEGPGKTGSVRDEFVARVRKDVASYTAASEAAGRVLGETRAYVEQAWPGIQRLPLDQLEDTQGDIYSLYLPLGEDALASDHLHSVLLRFATARRAAIDGARVGAKDTQEAAFGASSRLERSANIVSKAELEEEISDTRSRRDDLELPGRDRFHESNILVTLRRLYNNGRASPPRGLAEPREQIQSVPRPIASTMNQLPRLRDAPHNTTAESRGAASAPLPAQGPGSSSRRTAIASVACGAACYAALVVGCFYVPSTLAPFGLWFVAPGLSVLSGLAVFAPGGASEPEAVGRWHRFFAIAAAVALGTACEAALMVGGFYVTWSVPLGLWLAAPGLGILAGFALYKVLNRPAAPPRPKNVRPEPTAPGESKREEETSLRVDPAQDPVDPAQGPGATFDPKKAPSEAASGLNDVD